MRFGERIRMARERLGVSRDEMAKRLHLKYSTLAKYETSEREPDFATLVELARALRVSTDYILGYVEAPRGARRGVDEEALLAKYQMLSEDAKERVQNQVAFEYEQQRARRREPASGG